MNIGTVKWFSLEKGYGFIHPDDGRPNIFVRLSAVERAGLSGLKEGQRIIFEIEQDERGPTAVSLQALVFAPTPRLDDPFTTTNTFHTFSALVSSAFSPPRLRPH